MRLLIIRHADPDYTIDSLTEEGWKQAHALADRLCQEGIDTAYVSPMGRAKDTAAETLQRLNLPSREMDWLREFDRKRIWRPDNIEKRKIPWDWLPEDWTKDSRLFEADSWMQNERMVEGEVYENYAYVTKGFDELLSWHGLVREGKIYRVEKGNHETIALFCHLGVECVLLSHVLNVSPMVLWHGLCPLPSSVTTLVTEERRKGIASLRALTIADLSHLFAAGLTPSFAARFAECYEDDTRHD